MSLERYPKICIRSKNELAKRISYRGYSFTEAKKLVNEVLSNFNTYWKDSKRSEPENSKYVRSAKGSRLGYLLKRINNRVLAPYDALLPPFIFGGVKGRSHMKAAAHLLGKKRKRILLKADIKRFFEQIGEDRVRQFFQNKCGCTGRAARILSYICCVPEGPKGGSARKRILARGFATSSRLAVWCNLDLFVKLERLVQRRLKGKDPRLAVYVDDIGITASRVSVEVMDLLYGEIRGLFTVADPNQPLPLNDSKMNIVTHSERVEHLGVTLNRRSLTISAKTRSKRDRAKRLLRVAKTSADRERLIRKIRSISSYKRYLEGI